MDDDNQILQQIMTKLTVPIPIAGRAMGLGRNAAYAAAKRGDIPTIGMGKKLPVPTAWLKQKLLLDERAA